MSQPLSPDVTTAPSPPVDAESLSAFAPLKRPVFRMLWSTWLIANLCMWMNDVAAAWLMTSLTTSAVWVALVQTAATLPVFLLGIPSGALADILDRRRYFLFTQLWVAVVALALCAAVLSGAMSPSLLLGLIFFNGIGLAMRWPVFSAITPELVSRAQLPAALALNGVSMNLSRIVGPIVAGALIASAGTQWVFVLNAALSVVSALIIWRWRRAHVPHPLGREPMMSAMRVGVQFVGQSARLRAVLWRIACFFFHSTALMALPDWVRARGMSIYQMALMGGSAAGAAFWGEVANRTNLSMSLMIAAGSGVVVMLLVQRLATDRSVLEDLTPSSIGHVPHAPDAPKTGRVVVTIEYLIDPARADEFKRLMRISRRSRLRQGALAWDLLHDLNNPGRYVEQIVDQSWIEHLRRFDRVSADDVAVRERKLGFHVAGEPPLVSRYVVEPRPAPRRPNS